MGVDLAHHARVMRAAVYKSWRLSVTYPTWVLNRVLSPLVWVAIAVYAYVGVASPADISASFRSVAESPDFTGFLIVGQTVFSFFTTMNWRGGMALQRERWYGTIELLMVAPASRVANCEYVAAHARDCGRVGVRDVRGGGVGGCGVRW